MNLLSRRMNRRACLRALGTASLTAFATPLGAETLFGIGASPKRQLASTRNLSSSDRHFLEQLIQASCRYFVEQANAKTGLVRDRARVSGGLEERQIGSIAATGFGLSCLAISAARGYLTRHEAEQKVIRALEFLWSEMPHHLGFFHHFVDIRTGERYWKCEISTIDTALLLAGVLTVQFAFNHSRIRELASRLYARVDWRAALNSQSLLVHGWREERGIMLSSWEHYCEHNLLYLLALGSNTSAIPEASWHAWHRPAYRYEELDYIGSPAPLFVHQYSHAWIDFRFHRDRYANYFENSVRATEVHRRFCIHLSQRFPAYSEQLWGISASDSARGYQAWGGPPEVGMLDGSIVPCAAAGSLPFNPQTCLQTLKHQRSHYGSRIWGPYGFTDAFHPTNGWTNPDVIGIDLGITALMAENTLTGRVWNWFMQEPQILRGLARAGFKSG